jgi:hypothetical protein
MGDSKRRKQFDPNYGKSTLQPNLINFCNSAIAQETAFTILDFWADAGGVAIAHTDIANLKFNEVAAYELARSQTYLNLGIRRQQEQSLGALTVMDRYFREQVLGLLDDTAPAQFIFNWLSQTEIHKTGQEAVKQGKGKAAVFGIVNYLIQNCDPRHHFPCWFSGIPINKDNGLFIDLIFVCDRRNPSQKTSNTIITHENYL